MDTKQRQEAEERAWAAAPREYRSEIGGKRHILVRSYDDGTHLAPLSSLTEEELWRMTRR